MSPTHVKLGSIGISVLVFGLVTTFISWYTVTTSSGSLIKVDYIMGQQ